MAQGQHPGQVIVYRTGKDTTQHDPQERGGSELRPHNGAEDRSQSGDVQKLDHKDFPGRHRDIIHAVLMCVGRSLPFGIYAENTFNECTVDEITYDECNKATNKSNHTGN